MKEEERKNGRESRKIKNPPACPPWLGGGGCFFAAIPMGHAAGDYSAPQRHKTEVRFRLDEQGHNGACTTNPGLPAEAAAAKAGQSQSK